MSSETDKFLNQTKTVLDESVESLDAVTLSRLNQARQKALQTMLEKNAGSNWWSFKTEPHIAVYATVALLFISVLIWSSLPEMSSSPNRYQQIAFIDSDITSDIELLTSDAELELLDDLAFVSWLLLMEEGSDKTTGDAG